MNNLALARQGCNNHKYDRTTGRDPTSGQVVRLYHPRQDRWLEHFAWSPETVSTHTPIASHPGSI